MDRPARRPFLLVLSLVALAVAVGPADAQVQVTLPNRTLNVVGTVGNDRVLIADVGPLLAVLAIDGTGVITFTLARRRDVDETFISMAIGDDVVLVLADTINLIEGGPGDDILIGSNKEETIHGGPGRDRIFGRDGDIDDLAGQGDNDLVVGGPGEDSIEGNGGDDFLTGDADDDYLLGFSGNDLLVCGPGEDGAEGGRDDDWIFGGPGVDILWGEEGNDVLCGWTGADRLHGGPDDDHLFGEQGPDDHDGGLGIDQLYGNPVRGDTFANGNRVIGDFFCDGLGGASEITGMAETGTAVYGYIGCVYVAATPADDRIDVVGTGDAIEVIVHQPDAEPWVFRYACVSAEATVYVDASAGNDRIALFGDIGFAIVEGGPGDDTLDASEARYRTGVLLGSTGDDHLLAGEGVSFLAGEAGDDTIESSGAEDLISKGTGADTVLGADAHARVIEWLEPVPLLEPRSEPAAQGWLPVLSSWPFALLLALLVLFAFGFRRGRPGATGEPK